MSRSISLWYTEANGEKIYIDMGSSELLGGQQSSKNFWSLKVFEKIGVNNLHLLGHTDPIWFTGWEELKKLENEINLIESHIQSIPFHEETKERWISNLRNCLDELKERAPIDSVPEYMIG